MQEALCNVVSVWRRVPEPPADQRVIDHANASEARDESSALYVAMIQQATQTFVAD
ncbi:hypothetical protein AB0G81_00885 [Streptomyces asoensis]|uniref:hypothetical protein n=1 Tax=Streptomyces asoensis TaxID=249586 RepID=UPI0033DB1D10